ncbi:hypothetical protein [Brevibacillus laterosporus]|uniref:Uncharacterized protein n=1 Tax=Brevibacillus laterosporus TaxID=1465 RepID=A0AAP3DM02_BRELA|nr:hypothetical protein [Brevibacillus laterosporus]MBM7109723.1 hypothetical protein [Brevibacillus laterosporus]MCR8982444.1 hypothetical protein [Brevibacillus laterosporus]MCZ0809600.1 hypothetical protein [Brevibacillus laterosporus]MCZ0828133.1 hypothetical protein [Brevibacillus laterosporus]MCZ0852155.1 hypothetical protein [Brevibacillus laterosporus]
MIMDLLNHAPMVTTTVELAAGWSVEGAEGNIRKVIVIFIAIAGICLVLSSYSRGRKGKAFVEFLIGAVLAGLVSTGNPFKSFGEFFMGLLGMQ